MRSIWKGHIQFSLVTIPVRIYNAVDTEETIRFNQLHKEDNGAVGYDESARSAARSLTSEEIVKGYQFEPEQYVIVSPDDLAKIKLKSTKVIEIEGFIDASEIHPTLYESPYFAGPDGSVAAKPYSLADSGAQDEREGGRRQSCFARSRGRRDDRAAGRWDGALQIAQPKRAPENGERSAARAEGSEQG